MKIINLKTENFKKIKAIDITPVDNTVIISGKNGQGKSSILDSIFIALCGKDKETIKPVREGEDEATIQVDLGDYVIIKKIKADNTHKLVVESKDGAIWKKPQAMLNEIIGKLSFDPLEFSNRPEKEQRQILVDLVGIDTKELDEIREKLYEDRKRIGIERKALGKYSTLEIENAKKYQDKEEIDIISLSEKYQEELNKHNLYINAQERKEQIEQQINRLKKEIEEINKIEDTKENLEGMKCELDDADNMNKQIRESRKILENSAEVENKRIVYNDYTMEIEKIDKKKKEILNNIKMPIDGLEINDDGVLYNGIPFNQISTSEKLKVSTAIAMAMNPKLKVIRILDGSLLDEESLNTIKEMVKENDYQLWLESVSNGDKVGFYIEDGLIK